MVKVIKPALNKKWYGLIWAGLILASLLRGLYDTITGFESLSDLNAANVLVNVFVELVFSGFLPSLLCYLCASIFYSFVFRRGIIFCHRNDFIYITMIATMIARALMGIVGMLSMVLPSVYYYSLVLLDVSVLSTALYVMFFAVLKPRFMTERQASDAFGVLCPMYLLFQGLHTCIPCLVYFGFAGASAFAEELNRIMEDVYGMSVRVNPDLSAACIAAVSVYAALVIVSIVLRLVLKKRAAAAPPEPEETEPPHRPDINPFDELGGGAGTGGGSDKVFDEFDL